MTIPIIFFVPVLLCILSFALSTERVEVFSFSAISLVDCCLLIIFITAVSLSSSGVEKYYSSNNPFLSDASRPWMKAIPQSEGYPFAVTQYEPDNTGRIRAQGGVGADFQLGSGHETKYYYGKPSQYELDRLFGAEVGDHTHYLKNMVIDANGQVSVSYQNSEGKTIATALAGVPPDNLEALSGDEPFNTVVEDVLLTPSSFQVNNSNSSLEATSSFLVSSEAPYKFIYRFHPEQYNESYSGGQLCYTCSYDLMITLKDECGTVLHSEVVDDISPFNTSCSVLAELTDFFVENLEVGAYTVHFELLVDKETLSEYTDHYLESNTDIKQLSYFLLEQLVEENLDECYNDCESCSALPATVVEFQEMVEAYYTKENLYFGVDEQTFTAELYSTISDNCKIFAEQCLPNPCDEILDLLKYDVTPGGQYAEFDQNFQLVHPEINVLAHYTEVSYLDWEGNPAQVENESGILVAPSELTLKEFILNFEESWTANLVQYHPEYCYYTWCTMNSSSQAYDQNLEEQNDALKAIDDGLFDRNNPLALLESDPFFTSGYGTSYYSAMEDDLNSYSVNVMDLTGQTTKNIFEVIDFILYCGPANPPISWDNCSKSPDDPCRSAYKEWLLYKEWYLQRKLKYYYLAMHEELPECKNCFIPSSGGADPVSWASCIAPPVSSFTIEEISGSSYNSIKRILVKYNGGNEAIQ